MRKNIVVVAYLWISSAWYGTYQGKGRHLVSKFHLKDDQQDSISVSMFSRTVLGVRLTFEVNI